MYLSLSTLMRRMLMRSVLNRPDVENKKEQFYQAIQRTLNQKTAPQKCSIVTEHFCDGITRNVCLKKGSGANILSRQMFAYDSAYQNQSRPIDFINWNYLWQATFGAERQNILTY